MAPKYRNILLPAFLTGAKDKASLIRASSLSNLAELCKLLRFSLGSIIHEVSYVLIITILEITYTP